MTELLKRAKTIAVVGLSDNPMRASHGVSAYMQSHGYRIIPVNPQIESALGEKAYASLLEVPEKIDIVNIFRRPEFVEEVVDRGDPVEGSGDLDAGRCDSREGCGEGAPGGNLRRDGPLHSEGASGALPVRRQGLRTEIDVCHEGSPFEQ